MIKVFKTFPKELFRVNNGAHVQLREWALNRPVYDVILSHGLVQAKALNPSSYRAPNGASLRPNSPYQQQYLVSRIFKGYDIIVDPCAR
ncbi:hypothetical protein J3459_008392 [Metarhizium acridum]|nr:hypothetical protein J3459_008392 [Metarhizium acridum]